MMPLGVAPLDKTDVAPVSFALKYGWLVFLADGITETKLIYYTFNDAYFAVFFRQLSGQNAAEEDRRYDSDFCPFRKPQS